MGINKDQIKGRARQAKGAIKEATGDIVGSERLARKGTGEKHLGRVQATYGDARAEVSRAAAKKRG